MSLPKTELERFADKPRTIRVMVATKTFDITHENVAYLDVHNGSLRLFEEELAAHSPETADCGLYVRVQRVVAQYAPGMWVAWFEIPPKDPKEST
jgi:hypothetical protein